MCVRAFQALPARLTNVASAAEYFLHVAKLNQLLVLSQQLEEDIRHLGSHKYIAHQLSVIYVRTWLFLLCVIVRVCFVCVCVVKAAASLTAASRQLLQGDSGLLRNQEGHRGQLQAGEAVSSGGGRLQARAAAFRSLRHLVSSRGLNARDDGSSATTHPLLLCAGS